MYRNGEIPLSAMVHLGGDHYLPAGTAARWQWARAVAYEKYSVALIISPGWNAYRPLSVQQDYYRELGYPAAAYPGTSNHGGVVNGGYVMAVDVYNWSTLGWDRFAAVMRLAGFTVGRIATEKWHIDDFNEPWTVPAGAESIPTINHHTTRWKDDDMPQNTMIYTTATDKPDGSPDAYAVTNTNGYFSAVTGVDGGYATSLCRAYGIVATTWVTKSHWRRIEADCADQRAGKGLAQ